MLSPPFLSLNFSATGRAVRTSLRGSELAAISNSATEKRILANFLNLQGLTSHALSCLS